MRASVTTWWGALRGGLAHWGTDYSAPACSGNSVTLVLATHGFIAASVEENVGSESKHVMVACQGSRLHA